jgi:hypothetical protein
MSMRNERPLDFAPGERDAIDVLIDSAARQMVAGEPAASLRAEVRQRIERGRPWWLMAPALAGGVAVVATAAVLIGPAWFGPAGPLRERNDVRPAIERAGAPVQPPGVDSVDRSVLPWPAEARDEQRGQVDQHRLTRRLADDVTAAAELQPEEEPMIPPIVIEPLATVQIAVESSAVMPIEVEPLQIEPLRGVE